MDRTCTFFERLAVAMQYKFKQNTSSVTKEKLVAKEIFLILILPE